MSTTNLENTSEGYVIPSLFERYKERFKSFWKLFTDSPFGLIGLYLIIAFLLIGLLAPFLAPYNPSQQNTGGDFETPKLEHPLGTDRNGRDIFSQLVYGTQISLIVGLTAAFIALVIGTLIGLFSGFYGGIIDTLLMRITDFFIQIPALPLMLTLVMIFGASLENIILVIGLLGWTRTARVVRSETLSVKERSYIEATRAIGAKDRHLIFAHILPNVLPLVTSNAIINVVDAIITEAGLSFLGFGVTEGTFLGFQISGSWSWGKVLYEAQRDHAMSTGAWWHFLPPGLCLMFLALGFALVSFSLNEVVNPRLREK